MRVKNLERVAEVHFFLRPLLNKALKQHKLTDEGRNIVGNFETYFDFWTHSFSDRFFNMATAIRLGSAIESGLKEYYMHRKAHKTLLELRNDPNYKPNIFQRVQSWQSNGVISLYKSQLGYDLTTNPHLRPIQEAMMHRHLYAHNSGLIDDNYIDRIKQITGEDLLLVPEIANQYPMNDTYWFRPLNHLNQFIEDARRFFNSFT